MFSYDEWKTTPPTRVKETIDIMNEYEQEAYFKLYKLMPDQDGDVVEAVLKCIADSWEDQAVKHTHQDIILHKLDLDDRHMWAVLGKESEFYKSLHK